LEKSAVCRSIGWLIGVPEVGGAASTGGPGEGMAAENLRAEFDSNGEVKEVVALGVLTGVEIFGTDRDRGEGNNFTMLKTNSWRLRAIN
jgi:hypothetical protein